jgi:hypothetical protein
MGDAAFLECLAHTTFDAITRKAMLEQAERNLFAHDLADELRLWVLSNIPHLRPAAFQTLAVNRDLAITWGH